MNKEITVSDVINVRKARDVKKLVEIAESEQNSIVVRKKAIYSLARITTKASVEALLPFATNDDEKIRLSAIQNMKWVSTRYRHMTNPVLIKAALEDSDYHVAVAALHVLALIGDVSIAKPLVDLLKNEDDEEFLGVVSDKIGRIRNEEAREKVAELLVEQFKENNPKLELVALCLRRLHPSFEHFSTIRSYLYSTDANVRLAAVEALFGFGIRAAGPILAASDDPDPKVSEHAVDLLRIYEEENYFFGEYPESLLKDDIDGDDTLLKLSAAIYLSTQGDITSIDILTEHLQNPNSYIRELALDNLVFIGDVYKYEA